MNNDITSLFLSLIQTVVFLSLGNTSTVHLAPRHKLHIKKLHSYQLSIWSHLLSCFEKLCLKFNGIYKKKKKANQFMVTSDE